MRRVRSVLLAAIVVVAAAVPLTVAAEPQTAAQQTTSQTPGAQTVAAIQAQVQRAVARAEKSVVSIARVPKDAAARAFRTPTVARAPGEAPGALGPTDAELPAAVQGAGVVVDRSGLIITAYHVLGNVSNSDYYVWSQRRSFRASVLAADPWFDLAVLQTNQSGLEPIRFGNTSSLAKGQFVIALGNPQAIARDGSASASWGIISNLLRKAPRIPERVGDGARRDEAPGRDTVHHFGTLIQTDAHWDPGYSGGALLNLDGEMIGLTTAYAGAPDQARLAGFAIPADEQFQTVLSRLKAGKSPDFGFLGVGPRPMDQAMRDQVRFGVAVETVLSGSPAARAGIRPGDVITHADERPLYDDDDLFRTIGSLPPGQLVKLAVHRWVSAESRPEKLGLAVVLDKKHLVARRPAYATVAAPVWRGLSIDYASVAMHRDQALAPRLPPDGCIYVVDVEPESPGWKSGVRPGMFVLQFAGERVHNPREFFALARRTSGRESGPDGDVVLHLLQGAGGPAIHTVSP